MQVPITAATNGAVPTAERAPSRHHLLPFFKCILLRSPLGSIEPILSMSVESMHMFIAGTDMKTSICSSRTLNAQHGCTHAGVAGSARHVHRHVVWACCIDMRSAAATHRWKALVETVLRSRHDHTHVSNMPSAVPMGLYIGFGWVRRVRQGTRSARLHPVRQVNSQPPRSRAPTIS